MFIFACLSLSCESERDLAGVVPCGYVKHKVARNPLFDNCICRRETYDVIWRRRKTMNEDLWFVIRSRSAVENSWLEVGGDCLKQLRCGCWFHHERIGFLAGRSLPLFLTLSTRRFWLSGFTNRIELLRLEALVEIGCLVWPLGAYPNLSSPFEWIICNTTIRPRKKQENKIKNIR